MDVEQLTREIERRPPAAIPNLLARNYPLVLDNLWPLINRFVEAQPNTPPVIAAVTWMLALSVTQGSVSEDEPPALTPFGESLLDYVIQTILDEDAPVPPRSAAAIPTAEEMEALDAELWWGTTEQNPQGLAARVLARVTRCAILLAPEQPRRPRASVAVTALMLAEHLAATTDAIERPGFLQDAARLRAAAALVFTPEELAEQRETAQITYRNKDVLAHLRETLPEDEYERAAFALLARERGR